MMALSWGFLAKKRNKWAGGDDEKVSPLRKEKKEWAGGDGVDEWSKETRKKMWEAEESFYPNQEDTARIAC